MLAFALSSPRWLRVRAGCVAASLLQASPDDADSHWATEKEKGWAQVCAREQDHGGAVCRPVPGDFGILPPRHRSCACQSPFLVQRAAIGQNCRWERSHSRPCEEGAAVGGGRRKGARRDGGAIRGLFREDARLATLWRLSSTTSNQLDGRSIEAPSAARLERVHGASVKQGVAGPGANGRFAVVIGGR